MIFLPCLLFLCYQDCLEEIITVEAIRIYCYTAKKKKKKRKERKSAFEGASNFEARDLTIVSSKKTRFAIAQNIF